MFQPQPVQPREWVYMYVTANGEKRVHPVTQQPNEVYKNKNKVSLAKTKALLKTRKTKGKSDANIHAREMRVCMHIILKYNSGNTAQNGSETVHSCPLNSHCSIVYTAMEEVLTAMSVETDRSITSTVAT